MLDQQMMFFSLYLFYTKTLLELLATVALGKETFYYSKILKTKKDIQPEFAE